MREIKFRAFVKDENRIINEITFHEFEDINTQFEDDELVFMQYTGLTDKNGVEIYEGDIVATKNSKYKVIFDKCCFWGIDEMGKYPIYQISHYIMDDEKFEVIGNIYENPELLENKDERD